MANKESLIIELDAKTQKLDAKLKETNRRIDHLDGSVSKADNSLKKFSTSAKVMATAVTAIAASVAIAVTQAGKFSRELTIASNRAGESVENMQSLAFAANTVGISLEKIGDISKDTNEKVSEFLATGGGGFQDFADVLGLTAIEAKNAASEFESLSGPEVLQAMVSRMEAVGISGGKMSFALESDATDLIPLLKDNGEALKSLRTEFDLLNITISDADIEKINKVNKELEKAGNIFSQESKQLIADYSEELIAVINATVFLGQKTADTFNVIATSLATPLKLAQAALNDFVNDLDTFDRVLAERQQASAEALSELLGVSMEDIGYDAGKVLGNSLADGYEDGIKPLEIMIRKGAKDDISWEKLKASEKLSVQSGYVKAASVLGNAFLEDNKAIQAGIIVADTATGIMRAFATSSNIYEAYANAAVVAATGIAQLANLRSASKGGGNVSDSSSSGSSSSSQSQQDFQAQTSSLELTDSSAGGSTQQTITFGSDTGDDLVNAIAEALNKGMSEGRFT